MEIIIGLSTADEKSWSLPKALLSHHSGFFQRACRLDSKTFLEGEENKIHLTEAESEIFELFVQFMYFGEYLSTDDLKDCTRIRDTARAWVMGDFLDAIEFKNYSMKELYSIYNPGLGGDPIPGIGHQLIDFVCSRSLRDSPLWEFFHNVCVAYWHRIEVIQYDLDTKKEWDAVWGRHESFRNELLYYTNQMEESRFAMIKDKEHYLKKTPTENETAK